MCQSGDGAWWPPSGRQGSLPRQHGNKTVACSSALDWLREVQLRPYSTDEAECKEYEFPLDKAPESLDGYFQWVIDQYNATNLDDRRFDIEEKIVIIQDLIHKYLQELSFPPTGGEHANCKLAIMFIGIAQRHIRSG